MHIVILVKLICEIELIFYLYKEQKWKYSNNNNNLYIDHNCIKINIFSEK